MTLRAQLTDAMKTALKGGDKKRLSAVRLILAAIQERDNAAPADKGGKIADDEILSVMAKMIKQREESATTYEQAGRAELASIERDEIVVIRDFLPQGLSESESKAAVEDAIAVSGASGLKDMGKVMAVLKERHAGRMDFGKASALVKTLLSQAK